VQQGLIVLYCGTSTLVKHAADASEMAMVAIHCKSWQCEECAERMKLALRRKIADGHPDTFLTLTCNPARWKSPEDARAGMAVAWHKLMQQVRREWRYDEVPYAVVVEQTEDGWPHFHVALRVKWIGQKWLSDRWQKYTGASIVDIRRVKSRRGIARYLAKYLTKEPAAFPHKRRAWFGRSWSLEKDKRPKLFEAINGGWQKLDVGFIDAAKFSIPSRFTVLYGDGHVVYAADLDRRSLEQCSTLDDLKARAESREKTKSKGGSG